MKFARIDDAEDWITEQAVKESSTNLVPSKSILVVTRSGILRHSLPVALTARAVALNQDIKACIPNSNIHPAYLVNYLWFAEQDILDRCAKDGTTVESIDFEAFKKFPILLPPLEEQIKIAQILSTWDEALENLNALLEQKRRLKKGLMQRLLTGWVRFKEFEARGEAWEEVRFHSVFERVTRKNVEGNDNILTISGTHGLISQREFFNKRVASKDATKYFLLKRGEFAYNKSYSIGYDFGAIKRLERYESGVVSSLYICFRVLDEKKSNSSFYAQYFESGLFNTEISSVAQEGARNHGLLNVGVSEFFDLNLPQPPFEEQRKIALVLSTLDQEISTLEAEKTALEVQKRGLMGLLLTGKVRVQVGETADALGSVFTALEGEEEDLEAREAFWLEVDEGMAAGPLED